MNPSAEQRKPRRRPLWLQGIIRQGSLYASYFPTATTWLQSPPQTAWEAPGDSLLERLKADQTIDPEPHTDMEIDR